MSSLQSVKTAKHHVASAASKPSARQTAPARIGIFDSGIGGLTVLKAMLTQLPSSDFVYLGDTARLPYGTKSAETISRYAVQNINFLLRQNVDAVVVACNSASSVLALVRPLVATAIPIIGVIEAGCQQAMSLSSGKRIAVLATRATVASDAYAQILKIMDPACVVMQTACSLLVALVEEGWTDGPIVEAVIRNYLAPVMEARPDTLILGCTHFPVLRKEILKVVGEGVEVVDSAEAIASRWVDSKTRPGKVEIFLTDESSHFSFLASELIAPYALPTVQRIDLKL